MRMDRMGIPKESKRYELLNWVDRTVNQWKKTSLIVSGPPRPGPKQSLPSRAGSHCHGSARWIDSPWIHFMHRPHQSPMALPMADPGKTLLIVAEWNNSASTLASNWRSYSSRTHGIPWPMALNAFEWYAGESLTHTISPSHGLASTTFPLLRQGRSSSWRRWTNFNSGPCALTGSRCILKGSLVYNPMAPMELRGFSVLAAWTWNCLVDIVDWDRSRSLGFFEAKPLDWSFQSLKEC